MANKKYRVLKDCFFNNRSYVADSIVEIPEGVRVPNYFSEDISKHAPKDDFSFYDVPRSGLRNNQVSTVSEIEALRDQADELNVKYTKRTSVAELKAKLKEMKESGFPF